MGDVYELVEKRLLRQKTNEDIRRQFYHDVTYFTTDVDIPLAYIEEDGAIKSTPVKRLVVMTDKLEIEEMEFSEYCVTRVHIKFENMENYYELHQDAPTHEIVETDEVEPDVRAILSTEPHYGVSDIEGLFAAPDEDYTTSADITWDWKINHDLVPEWHSTNDFIIPRLICVCDVGGKVAMMRESVADLMYTTYNVQVVIFYCLR